jgi:hypothetical protein
MAKKKDPAVVTNQLCIARMNALEWKLRALVILATTANLGLLYLILHG